MKTHNGNVGKITADVGKITIDTLENFEIPYDELYFGKPYAHAYIDDLVINAFDDYQQELGVNNFSIDERDFNSLEDDTIPVITKKSENADKLKGEIEWYLNLPRKLYNVAPSLISYDDKKYSEYCIERIQGLTFQELFLSESLNTDGLKKLLNVIKRIHSFKSKNTNINIYENYANKLKNRYESYDYSDLKNADKIYKKLEKELINYESNKQGQFGIIHGDPVFSNVLMDKIGNIKLIDPRGTIGKQTSIYGDIFYDYAKIYQSLIGYDEVMQSKSVSDEFRETFVSCLFDHVKKEHGDECVEHIKTITNSLLFTLIPLHDNENCKGYFNLINI